MVALLLVQEEAKCIGLGHSELGGTELVQGGNRGPWGHSQGLGGAATARVLVGYSEEVLCRKTSEIRAQSCLVYLWLRSLRSQDRLCRDRVRWYKSRVEPRDESFLDKRSCKWGSEERTDLPWLVGHSGRPAGRMAPAALPSLPLALSACPAFAHFIHTSTPGGKSCCLIL